MGSGPGSQEFKTAQENAARERKASGRLRRTRSMPTSDARRAEIERLRTKAWQAYDQLTSALDEDDHDFDCVLRCMDDTCEQTHSCTVCREDGEV